MDNKLISIIVPIYNVEKYITKCINSIINQTYKNLEIILIDDGSTDKCGKICDEYNKKDNRIKVIHKENGGLSDARNVGIDIAKGYYIGFVDSDDYVENDMFEYLYNLITNNNADISICDFKSISENCNTKINEHIVEETTLTFNKEEALEELLIDEKINNYAWNKLYKKSLFNEIRYPKGRKMEDIGTTYKLFFNSDKIVLGNQVKYNYIKRQEGIFRTKGSKFYIDFYDALYERYIFIKQSSIAQKNNSNAFMSHVVNFFLVEDDLFEQYLKDNNTLELCKKIYKDKKERKKLSRKVKIKLLCICLNCNLYKKGFRWYFKCIKKMDLKKFI